MLFICLIHYVARLYIENPVSDYKYEYSFKPQATTPPKCSHQSWPTSPFTRYLNHDFCYLLADGAYLPKFLHY